MKQSIDFNDFDQAFQAIRPDNFSYEGLRALFNYLEDVEDTHGEECDLDVIALCCDYSEDSYEDISANYGLDNTDPGFLLSFLKERTAVVGETNQGTIVYQQF